ncbi:glutamate--cysteine ligase [Herbihabitans rhizosphaerae]|uniref:Glutamate--cysteine ligase EgtA n=1 Tax=Herbihabitans rhizosphaerae TaxID=1872711 RepID=A0A4Q7L2B0_9PSEU|nr:ergothioneine biosynthesis glutamate--cysteine ligase EgtA [Herbihabitans rhizosphaerae]RZS43226.1 glutamate--cysteine ligase [Herbihabitans rhizosphaerae]
MTRSGTSETSLPNPSIVEPARRWIRERHDAEAYVASVCFKHGPPKLTGVELEWTVHHTDDPRRPLDADRLAAALGSHAPRTLRPDSPAVPLPGGSPISLEPGGQVEISALPQPTLTELFDVVGADIAHLSNLLADAGLALGSSGTDPHRPPQRVLDTPRYAAMEKAFEPMGDAGITMMCSTAGLQVCVDAGERDQVADRWAAVHALGPVLVALFANSTGLRGTSSDWSSERMRTVLATDPSRTRPGAVTADPAAAWAAHVLDTPLLCLRRDDGCWEAPAGVTFADWTAGALPNPPSVADLDYHLTTLFPPVRPQGYLEVRYIDAQPGPAWMAPVALVAALLSTPSTVDRTLDACAPAVDRWIEAARDGLADPPVAEAARKVVEIGVAELPNTGVSPSLATSLADDVHLRLDGGTP